jgi:methyl-accepting chemotaxis protein
MPIFNLRFERHAEAIAAALTKSQAMAEFDLDGRITAANQNFCLALGYQREEIIGKHHSIFCDRNYASSSAYRHFWENLGRGQFEAGEYICLGKEGREVRIEASYNPLLSRGRPYKVIKLARVITGGTRSAIKAVGEIDRLSREIGRMISVVDDAAVETNLLALERWCHGEAAT